VPEQRHLATPASQGVAERSDEETLAGPGRAADPVSFMKLRSKRFSGQPRIAPSEASRSSVVATPHVGEASAPTTPATSKPLLWKSAIWPATRRASNQYRSAV